ncbi:MAG: aspartate kinase, partial [Bacteroidales bacterium]|nr:aspartate kinase [Bacteroidales bacterium]
MKVLKFSGSSLNNLELVSQVKKIVEEQSSPVAVVISTFNSISGKLNEISKLAKDGAETYTSVLDLFIQQIESSLEDLKIPTSHREQIQSLLISVKQLLDSVFILSDLSPKTTDRVFGCGALISAKLVQGVLTNADFIDSRELIITDSTFGGGKVDFNLSAGNVKRKFDEKMANVVVLPANVASTPDGITTTLGEGGDDYSAAILASALNATQLEIWTGKTGYMTADPNKVKKAFSIPSMTYAEAMELSHFGVEVIHSSALLPVYQENIITTIKNINDSTQEGTSLFNSEDASPAGELIKGVSSLDNVVLITLQGPGMVGVKGISSRLFGALATSGISVILITQASSEYSITFAVSPEDEVDAVSSINHEFNHEIETDTSIKLLIEHGLSIIAIVGERMKNTPGISATLFESLGRNGINVVATAQGSSELNISVVVKKESLRKALNVIHEGFFLSHCKELHLYIAGVGTV